MIEMTAAPAAHLSAPDAIYAWGLEVIRALQGAGNPAITAAARFFSALGHPITYIAIAAFVYWCVDERRGAKLGIVTFLSYGINNAIKGALRVPRPYVQDPTVGMAFEPSYSTPSAHAQAAAAFWPTLALEPKTPDAARGEKAPGSQGTALKIARWTAGWAAAILLPVLIGLSRVYLGVHYPTDVLFGWALGAVISILAIPVWPRFSNAIFSLAPVNAAVGSIRDRARSNGRSLRSFKLALAAFVALLLNALSGQDSSMGGAFFGFTAGFIFLTDESAKTDKHGNARETFSAASGSLIKKGARFLIGLAFLIVIYVGSNKLVPLAGGDLVILCLFVQYGFIGFWISYLAPRIFVATGLAE
jgi:membrane-associated phospholipid phosphatase